MTVIERQVRVDRDRNLYVIENADGQVSCLGFSVCLERTERYCLELIMRGILGADYMEGVNVACGTISAYDTMVNLQDMLKQAVEESGEPAVCGLSPQLVGLEGHRVEVVDRYGVTRRFIVGQSTGWMPCHLEIKRRGNIGGDPADREYQSVADLGSM